MVALIWIYLCIGFLFFIVNSLRSILDRPFIFGRNKLFAFILSLLVWPLFVITNDKF